MDDRTNAVQYKKNNNLKYQYLTTIPRDH